MCFLEQGDVAGAAGFLVEILEPIPALCRSTILSLSSLDSSLVLAMVESLESA